MVTIQFMANEKEKTDLTEAALRGRLTAEQYHVTQEKGTERAFTGEYVDMKADGTYACICCGASLFSAEHKYDSGSGWPSFWLPLAGDNVAVRRDSSHGMTRDEVVCSVCDSHLGHVFTDGPQPSGMRYCINSLSLDFDPKTGKDE
jgi:peptide-methionine (R)-S-oxide reductase